MTQYTQSTESCNDNDKGKTHDNDRDDDEISYACKILQAHSPVMYEVIIVQAYIHNLHFSHTGCD